MIKKILVVDNDPKDLSLISGILEKGGYEVESVVDGATAFDFISKDKFDLVLIDILMPTLSGYDLLILLKERSNNFKVAYISVVPKKKVNLGNIDGFIQKPFTPEFLLKSVKEIIGE